MNREVLEAAAAADRAHLGMKYTLVLLLAICLAVSASGQSSKSKNGSSPPRPTPTSPKPLTESESFEAAIAMQEPDTRAAALKAFLEKFPESEKKTTAQEQLTVSLTETANIKMQVGDIEGGVALFREAVESAPSPIPEKLYTETVLKIVPSLYFHGEQREALAIGEVLEPKLASNLSQLLLLGNFYVSIENGEAAKRVALRAVEAAPDSTDAYLMLAIAHRLQFELEQSAVAYSKALDLKPANETARRGLADMYRALGRFTDAAAQYKEILVKDSANIAARTGLVLALFDSGEKAAAEKELDAAMEANPGNVILLAGAAYWYAVHSEPDRAVELSQKAISIEPRYVWSHMALARAYFAKNQPLDAEQALLRGRQYGRFPTLEYELALARAKAGLYREAIEVLRGSFSIDGEKIRVRLGGRVEREGPTFTELLAPERKASIFEPESTDDPVTGTTLKALLAFDKEVQASSANEAGIDSAADRFVEGDDAMKVHRQIYIATALLDKNVALSKVIELTKSAVDFTEQGLNAPNASAATMASELYDSRMLALSKNEYLHIPEVPKPMLSAILRGRIEELAGWALYQEGKTADAVTRLRRAVSVLPQKSAWWRSSTWKLGAALQADGKDAESLEYYLKSYKADKPDAARYIVVEALYKKLKGSDEGLEAEIGPNPMQVTAAVQASPMSSSRTESAPTPTPQPSPTVSAAVRSSRAEVIPEIVPVAIPTVEPKADETKTLGQEAPNKDAIVLPAEPITAPKIEPASVPPIQLDSEPKIEPAASVLPSASPTPEISITPLPQEPAALLPVTTGTPQDSPAVEPKSTPPPKIEPDPTPTPIIEPEPARTEPAPEVIPSPTPDTGIPTSVPSPSPERPLETKPAEPPKPIPEEPKPQREEVARVVKSTIQPPGERIPIAPPSKSSNLSVVVTENILPPTTIKPPLPTRTRKSSTANSAAKKDTPIKNGPLFEPVIITVPRRASQTETPIAPRICTVSVSQERLSLAGGGGNIGLLVGTGDPADLRALKFYSSSPSDVAVRQESRIAGDDRAFFVIRSLSKNTGIYQVTFEAPCGKKQVIVNVR